MLTLCPFAVQVSQGTVVPRQALEVRAGAMAETLRQVGRLPASASPAQAGATASSISVSVCRAAQQRTPVGGQAAGLPLPVLDLEA